MKTPINQLKSIFINSNLSIDYGKDEKSGISVVAGRNYFMISSKNSEIHAWSKDSRTTSEMLFSCNRISTENFDLYLEDYSKETDSFIFYDKLSNELINENTHLLSEQSLNRITSNIETINLSYQKITKELNKKGFNFIKETYPWLYPYMQGNTELHISHPGGFSIYYIDRDLWEFDSSFSKDTVRAFKRVLKYK